ncbi:MAG: TIGR04084 family radical SAM/SPASM domain-containing protein [Methanocalculus sp.]|uniref:TIGR04084 family radical SAM/SPASM domain-containing protein n=1 Tax=Methanocalculus sp. TaxID=2004547 RepID=UPI002715EABD|nr:TIGR04084 family radical SAM/SPASM domain-containing protein [Methanocalculus sp.]MDO9538932.1 TIGR04084 family radical SAM/SPASM domain-containing protein [Methanocalculus sp.]
MVFFHLYVTDDCNLACRYCRGRMFDDLETVPFPCEISIDLPAEFDISLLSSLKKFIAADPAPVLTFIGGEPLLRSDLICRIMDETPCERYMLQTNGLLLGKLPAVYRNRFETILISIDGDENLTNYHRGEGVYRGVLKNARMLREDGFTGELIARMTVDEDTDILSSVLHLAMIEDNPFSSIHWQMDAGFWGDYHRRSYSDWVEKSYNPGITALARHWVDHMAQTGEVLFWYPFLQTTEDLLLERISGLRCGSGVTNFTIQTDGSIIPCPIMIGMSDYVLGDIRSGDPLNLPPVFPGSPCTECSISEFCGGRCLYSNVVRPWPVEGIETVCSTVYHLRSVLNALLPTIQNLINEKVIDISSFAHTRFNGCEIIP